LSTGVVLPLGTDDARGPRHWVLARALLRCRFVALGHVPAGQRRAALRNQLLAWAPFDQPDFRIAWRNDAALAVAWDRAAVDRLLAAAGARTDAQLWPEIFLRQPMAGDGLRVLPGLEGIEAQLWRDRMPVASRWWPTPPDAAEAALWLHSLGADAGAVRSLPRPAPVPWLRRPWADLQSLDGLLSTSSRLERIAVGGALVGFAALTASQGHQAFAAYEDRQSAQRERERVMAEAAPVLATRERAEALAREALALATQLTGVLPLEVLEHVGDFLPARVTLKEMELAGQKLRLALELAPDVARSAVVKELQAGTWLTEISEVRDAASGRGWVGFDAVLAGLRAPTLPERPRKPPQVAAPAAPPPPLVAASPAAPAAAAPSPFAATEPAAAPSPFAAPGPERGPASRRRPPQGERGADSSSSEATPDDGSGVAVDPGARRGRPPSQRMPSERPPGRPTPPGAPR
jgi:hypothetical protein